MSINILVMGGWSFSSTELDPLTGAVPAESHVTLLTPPDCSNPGSSPEASLLQRFSARVQGQKFDLAIGWSMGGMLILEAMLQGALNARHLLLFSSCARFLQADDYPEGVCPKRHRAMQMLLKRNRPQCVHDFRLASAHPNQTKHTDSAWSSEDLAEGLTFLADFDVRSQLSEITQPALIIHGENDSIIQTDSANRLHTYLPNSRLVLVPKAGHDFCIRNNVTQAEWIHQALEPAPAQH